MTPTEGGRDQRKEFLLKSLSLATFIIFFQIYMVAPIILDLSHFFDVSEQNIGMIIPAFLIPYGVSSLFYGLFADRVGTQKVILSSFLLFALLTVGTILSQNVNQLIIWRIFAGIVASGVIPISLAWIGKTYTYEKRGRPIGYIFGAVAGEGAFGAFAGALLESYIGWKWLFLGVGIAAFLIWILIFYAYSRVKLPPALGHQTLYKIFEGYKNLLGRRTGQTHHIFNKDSR